jgi:hypothetical protein
MVTFNRGHITNITDQSGHYKPEAELTFQAVQQLNRAAEESDGRVQSPLINKAVNTGGREDGALPPNVKKLLAHLERIEAEIDDNLDADPQADVSKLQQQAKQIREALISANIDLEYNKEATVSLLGKAGMLTDDEYKPLLQAYRSVTQNTASSDLEKQRARQKLQDDVNRASALKQLQAPLGEAEYAKLLLTGQPKPADQKAESAVDQAMRARKIEPGSSGDVKALKATLGAEAVAKIEGDDAKVEKLCAQCGIEGVNRANALKRLQEALGEEEYANLLPSQSKPQQAKVDGAIEQAMRARNIEPGTEGAVKALKAALGAEAVAKIKDDDAKVLEFSAQYGVVAIDKEFDGGSERMGFEVGTKSAATLTAQQFLQTGGNEAQIRTKQRLLKEIQPDADTGAVQAKASGGNNNNQAATHPAIARVLQALDSDLPARKQGLETALKQLDREIARASMPGYSGEVDKAELAELNKQKVKLQQEMAELLTEIERQANKNAGDHKPSVPESGPDEARERQQRIWAALSGKVKKWQDGGLTPQQIHQKLYEEEQVSHEDAEALGFPRPPAKQQPNKNAATAQQQADAERLQFIRAMLGGKIRRWQDDGLTSQEIHQKLHDQEKVSHEDATALGFHD